MTLDRRSTSALIAVGCIALGQLVWLAVEVKAGHTQAFDLSIRDEVHRHASRALTDVAELATTVGSLLLVSISFAVSLLALAAARLWREAVRLIVVLAGAIGLENGLKFSVRRIRPEAFFGADPTTYSFPSGHSLWSLCVYLTIAALFARCVSSSLIHLMIWAAALVLIASIGLSRIYLGVHYPTDVIGGFLTAVAWLSVVGAAERLIPQDRSPQWSSSVADLSNRLQP